MIVDHAFVPRSQPSVRTRHEDIDIVLMRQNTEGEYAQLEHESVPGVVESLKIATVPHCDRLCRSVLCIARNQDCTTCFYCTVTRLTGRERMAGRK